MSELKKPDLSILAKNWSCPFVARAEVKEFSGGILNSKSLANLDSAGLGPTGRIRIGRKIAYPVSSLISWMENRTEVIQ